MCLSYDVVIKTNYGGLDSDPFYIFINGPNNTIAADDVDGGTWNYTFPYYDGYRSRINYKTLTLCGLDPPMSDYHINESFGTWQYDWISSNWQRGLAEGWPVVGDQWRDEIYFCETTGLASCFAEDASGNRRASCGAYDNSGYYLPQTCVPTPRNPGPEYVLVDHVPQVWRVGSSTPGWGVPVQTDTLRRFTDQGEHQDIVTPVPPQ